jgi:hypothetical protein
VTAALIPDAEVILGRYLREHPAVKALNARVVTKPPSETQLPWVRVVQHDALAVGGSRSERLIEWFGTFDCFAGQSGDEDLASRLVRTVRAALNELHDVAPVGAVVNGVSFISCPRQEDDSFEPAMARYPLSAIVWLHR